MATISISGSRNASSSVYGVAPSFPARSATTAASILQSAVTSAPPTARQAAASPSPRRNPITPTRNVRSTFASPTDRHPSMQFRRIWTKAGRRPYATDSGHSKGPEACLRTFAWDNEGVLDLCQRLVEVGQEIAERFETDRDPDVVRGRASQGLLFFGQLGVSGAGGVNDERLRVADIRQVREDLDRFNELLASFESAFDAESENRPVQSFPVIFRRGGVGRMAGKTGVIDPAHLWVLAQIGGDRHGVLAVALHADRQRFQPLDEEPGVEWRCGSADIAQPLHAELEDEGERSERL